MLFRSRAISITNFAVATSALGFQVFVLYPWHKELDEGFEALKKEHLRVLDAINKATDQHITAGKAASPTPTKSIAETLRSAFTASR